ncbi:MAG: Fe-S cluster assembly protein HesB [Actinobacteria bacterium]|nr:Fe-S cluster assembly protein HesB [Actinomycetota bacterium]
MYLASTPAANAVLEQDPLALLLGMMLDQQIPMEKAFTSPSVLRDRIGRDLDAAELATWDPAAFEEIFATPPALHRFPVAMAKRAQVLCAIVADKYGGDAAAIWTTAKSGNELVSRVAELPGFGAQKARIFTALVGKQLAVRPRGWREASEPYGRGGTFASAADVVDQSSLTKVKAYKREQKALAKAADQ